MKSHARVVVIGGGVVGVETLYHLAWEGLGGRRPLRAPGIDLGLDLARGRPPAALQPLLLSRRSTNTSVGFLPAVSRPRRARMSDFAKSPTSAWRKNQGSLRRVRAVCRRRPDDRRSQPNVLTPAEVKAI